MRSNISGGNIDISSLPLIDHVRNRLTAEGLSDRAGAFGPHIHQALFAVKGQMGIDDQAVVRRVVGIAPRHNNGWSAGGGS